MSKLPIPAFVRVQGLPESFGRTAAWLLAIVLLLISSACASRPFYDTAPPMPTALSPEQGTVLRAQEPIEFVWTRTAETEAYEFHIFNAQNSDIDRYMKTELEPSTICDDRHCRLHLYLSLPESSRHAWRVRSVNMAGKSAWTRSVFSFAP